MALRASIRRTRSLNRLSLLAAMAPARSWSGFSLRCSPASTAGASCSSPSSASRAGLLRSISSMRSMAIMNRRRKRLSMMGMRRMTIMVMSRSGPAAIIRMKAPGSCCCRWWCSASARCSLA